MSFYYFFQCGSAGDSFFISSGVEISLVGLKYLKDFSSHCLLSFIVLTENPEVNFAVASLSAAIRHFCNSFHQCDDNSPTHNFLCIHSSYLEFIMCFYSAIALLVVDSL